MNTTYGKANRFRRLLATGIAIPLAVLLFFSSGGRAMAQIKAPDFTLLDLSGRTETLSAYQGKVVIVDFWASWCMPCRLSIPELVKLQAKYREKGLQVLGISMDTGERASDKSLLAFKRKYNINYPILHPNQQLVLDYFGGASQPLPTAIVIDKEGGVRDVVVGYRPGALESTLKDILD